MDALRELSGSIDAQESLVPWTGIERLIEVAPLTETGDGRGVDFFVVLGAAVVLDAVLDGGDDEDEEDGNTGGSRLNIQIRERP